MNPKEKASDYVNIVNLRVLLFIPGLGLFASIIMFISVDVYRKLFNRLAYYSMKISRLLVQVTVNQKPESVYPDEASRNRLIKTTPDMLNKPTGNVSKEK